jgi:hypothetical protein
MNESGLTGSRRSGASITMAADMHGIVSHKPACNHEGTPWFALPAPLAADRCMRVPESPGCEARSRVAARARGQRASSSQQLESLIVDDPVITPPRGQTVFVNGGFTTR